MPLPAEKALFTHAGTSAHAETPAPSSGAASWEAEMQSTLYLPPSGSGTAPSSVKRQYRTRDDLNVWYDSHPFSITISYLQRLLRKENKLKMLVMT